MSWKQLWCGSAEAEVQCWDSQLLRQERGERLLAESSECLRRSDACDVSAGGELAGSRPTQHQWPARQEVPRKVTRGVELVIDYPPIGDLVEVAVGRIAMAEARNMVLAEPAPGPSGSPYGWYGSGDAFQKLAQPAAHHAGWYRRCVSPQRVCIERWTEPSGTRGRWYATAGIPIVVARPVRARSSDQVNVTLDPRPMLSRTALGIPKSRTTSAPAPMTLASSRCPRW